MPIKLEIRGLLSWDVDDLTTWCPLSSSDVYILVEIEIGEAGVSGEHIFQLILATPEGLRKHHVGDALKSFQMMQRRGSESGREALVVIDRYDLGEMRTKLQIMVADCEKESWDRSLDCLRRKFFWEYEGIKYK